MNLPGLVFIILILLGAFKYTKVLDIPWLWIIGIFIIWLSTIYVNIHMKNKERDTPRPVYIQNPY